MTARDRATNTNPHGCRTVVISGLHAPNGHTDRLSRLAGELTGDSRFDLLTVPQPASLTEEGPLLEQVAADAELAAKLHHANLFLVTAPDAPAIAVALRRKVSVEVKAVDAVWAEPTRTVAVTCMDFRQHDGGLDERLHAAFPDGGHPQLLSMAGGAKDFIRGTAKCELFIPELWDLRRRGGLERLILTMHTDCGAMGGSSAPCFCGTDGRPSPRLQEEVLGRHLRAAGRTLREALPDVDVQLAIVEIDAQASNISEVIPVTAD